MSGSVARTSAVTATTSSRRQASTRLTRSAWESSGSPRTYACKKVLAAEYTRGDKLSATIESVCLSTTSIPQCELRANRCRWSAALGMSKSGSPFWGNPNGVNSPGASFTNLLVLLLFDASFQRLRIGLILKQVLQRE